MSIIYENITLDLDKITDERIRHIAAATDELMDEKLASIGYVKVVRCGDCAGFEDDGYDETICHFAAMVKPNKDDFCSYGERRDA